MTRDDVLAKIRAHRGQIESYGVVSIAVFGSFARDEATPDSDVDLLVEFASGLALSFDRYFGLKECLEELLGRPVDLVPRPDLKPRLRAIVEQEAIRVA